jgi:hypothetical protein
MMLAVLNGGCISGDANSNQEPAYDGRTLSEWLSRANDGGLPPEQQAIAVDAIRHIGKPALPFLVARLGEAKQREFSKKMEQWRKRQATAIFDVPCPPDPRTEALIGLDALGSEAADALPALERLLDENPPDPRVLYIAARVGPASVPLLKRAMDNPEKLIRIQAGLCLEMLNSKSALLYPNIPVGPDAPSLQKRLCEFNVLILKVVMKEYKAPHPEMEPPMR